MLERRLPLIDAQLTLASLAALPGPGARAGAGALIELSGRYGLRRVDDLQLAWLQAAGSASSAPSIRSARRLVSAAVCSSTSRLARCAHDVR